MTATLMILATALVGAIGVTAVLTVIAINSFPDVE